MLAARGGGDRESLGKQPEFEFGFLQRGQPVGTVLDIEVKNDQLASVPEHLRITCGQPNRRYRRATPFHINECHFGGRALRPIVDQRGLCFHIRGVSWSAGKDPYSRLRESPCCLQHCHLIGIRQQLHGACQRPVTWGLPGLFFVLPDGVDRPSDWWQRKGSGTGML